eukprot:1576599-Prymnesium_polylepis.1
MGDGRIGRLAQLVLLLPYSGGGGGKGESLMTRGGHAILGKGRAVFGPVTVTASRSLRLAEGLGGER